MTELIYKICRQTEWDRAVAAGRYTGSPDDQRDGFIHFSTAEQVAGTAAKHFAGLDDLVLVAVDTSTLGDDLKWEPSRGGALFPHLYGPLDVTSTQSVKPMPLKDGAHVIPLASNGE